MLLIILCFLSFAQQETYKDMIAKAERLTLQREREKALQILNLSLEDKNLSLKQKKEVLKAYDRISEMFLEDKTQSLYAKARAETEKNLAQTALRQAINIEPQNITLYLEQAQIAVTTKSCRDESNYALEGIKVHPYYAPLILIYLQALVCEEQKLDSSTQIPTEHLESTTESTYILALKSYLQDSFKNALRHIEEAIQQEESVPNYYWLKDKILQALELSRDKNHQAWRQACEKQKKSVKRYPWQIEVCTDILKEKVSL